MNKWIVIGMVSQDLIIVHADLLKIDNGVAHFKTLDDRLVLATKIWTSIMPVQLDDYYSDKYHGIPELNKERK